MNHQIIDMMLREKREDLLREAKRQRLIAEYEKGRSRPVGRLAVSIGELLIRLGEKLKAQYTLPQAETLPEACGHK